ncbi:hypothetical protein B2J93_6112 [Marssonina coronariae]|uniref:Adenosine deaminase domain-containing protein n=1 Tax=Diplocarpon coronariae TaxID=2795749 RepID=A0A218YV60_9HELO|nr:hypothetical protein B2J93_6112 [Marssonina coronariae]
MEHVFAPGHVGRVSDGAEAALPYKEMIVGIGLDSDELDQPRYLFGELLGRSWVDSFRITSHSDLNQKNTHEHIRQVAETLGGSGADRLDRGMNAALQEEIDILAARCTGMPFCPCVYIRHTAEGEVFPHTRKLFGSGIKFTIASDDPAYMEDNWLLRNLCMVRDTGQFTDRETMQLHSNAIDTCWASDMIKRELSARLDRLKRSRTSE